MNTFCMHGLVGMMSAPSVLILGAARVIDSQSLDDAARRILDSRDVMYIAWYNR